MEWNDKKYTTAIKGVKKIVLDPKRTAPIMERFETPIVTLNDQPQRQIPNVISVNGTNYGSEPIDYFAEKEQPFKMTLSKALTFSSVFFKSL